MSHDIYKILELFDQATESLSPAQEKVKQLPALFKPKDTSPQLNGPYPGKNATLGYLVGEGEEITEAEDDNAMRRAVTNRIMHSHIDWAAKYGVEALVQAIDDATEGDEDLEEIGTSDVSARIKEVERMLSANDELPFEPTEPHDTDEFGNVIKHKARHLARKGMRQAQGLGESATTEDVISKVQKKLGDYLSDLSKEIKKDPDLKDKLEKDIDQIGPAVKTLKTDDGKEIRIHGNEDDGFRITIKSKPLKTEFKSLDEAVMASEMYCAKRRGAAATPGDYIEEA